MCLVVDSKNPQIAKKDMACYKVCLNTEYEFLVITPYQLAYLRIGAKYEERSNECFTRTTNDYILTGDVYHSFKYLADARRDIKTWNTTGKNSLCIVKCVIPKGSKYYLGSFDDLGDIFPSYGSKQIILIKKIK